MSDDDRERQAAARDEQAVDQWLSDSFGVPIPEPIPEPERRDDDEQPATDGDAQIDAWIDGAFGLKP